MMRNHDSPRINVVGWSSHQGIEQVEIGRKKASVGAGNAAISTCTQREWSVRQTTVTTHKSVKNGTRKAQNAPLPRQKAKAEDNLDIDGAMNLESMC